MNYKVDDPPKIDHRQTLMCALTGMRITECISVKNVASRFPEYKERMLSTHSLRHFFITNSKSCGINAGKVEKIAGHSLRGMQEVYTNFKAEDLTDILKWQKDLFLELNS